MKQWIKFMLAAALAGMLMLGTSGCGVGFTLSPDELYRLPKLPAEYTELDKQLSAMISAGQNMRRPPPAPISSPCSWRIWTGTAGRRRWLFCGWRRTKSL